ncbi:helix-turn-helix domain-containing protein [Thalassomonas actiniarum]|uniref:Helix-turn-helix transcriptional regulator n=1 Tax=Thalassomonas actiniarum TaxID=485447 RepID=A0AAE9YQY1_9GAMM|nr:AraC family transcriptional regulator [Thalassomonas actiniarum]WDD99634.1 helix-turn-helix transcriptional regulator [Thalassomonas actiniarum]
MEDLLLFAITMATLGQIVLCIPLLLADAKQRQSRLPLTVYFFASAVLATGPAIYLLLPAWYSLYIAAVFPAWFLLGPSFYLYVQALTSSTPWKMQGKHLIHVIPAGFGLAITMLVLTLTPEQRQGIFIDGAEADSGLPLLTVISIFLSLLVWIIQSIFYVTRIMICLSRYRKQLKNLFANNDNRELGWLYALLILVVSTWIFSLLAMMSDLALENTLTSRLEAILSLVLVWSLAYLGLRQKPGFEGRYGDSQVLEINPLDDKEAAHNAGHTKKMNETGDSQAVSTEAGSIETEQEETGNSKKYQRSALSEEQALRIAEKINTVMAQEQLYLDSTLSLNKLAQHLAISPNYISQTLNETLDSTFFDFINQWRIKSAKPMIIENKANVLTIALEVGFNARSSFYKAFKKETGMTPGDFRKSHAAGTCELVD